MSQEWPIRYDLDSPQLTREQSISITEDQLADLLKLRESMRGDMYYTTTIRGIRYREYIISKIEGLQLQLERERKWKEEEDASCVTSTE